MRTKVLNFFSFFLAENAIPVAIAKPCPSDPVDASTPGTEFLSGCTDIFAHLEQKNLGHSYQNNRVLQVLHKEQKLHGLCLE